MTPPIGSKLKWSDDERETLRALALDGYTAQEIADRMNRRLGSVRAEAVKLKVRFQNAGQWRALRWLKDGGVAERQVISVGGPDARRAMIVWTHAHHSGGPDLKTDWMERRVLCGDLIPDKERPTIFRHKSAVAL